MLWLKDFGAERKEFPAGSTRRKGQLAMKITSLDVIRNGERDLMDAITADLDWSAVERIFKERHNLRLEEDIEYKRGDIVVHNEQIAYRLDFVAKVTLSVLLDRDGNNLAVDVSGAAVRHEAPKEESTCDDPSPDAEGEGYEKVLSQLGEEDVTLTGGEPS
ncbi:MAG: hypothetical protein C4576_15655 [Desulfobacteraceae bacterium]|nr:MAG: hypothetical protein C4576_15655 [Desulfobacteraceae bacterium]